MKILITGANGMLAQEVKKQLKEGNELIFTDVKDLDITNENQVKEYISNLKPEYTNQYNIGLDYTWRNLGKLHYLNAKIDMYYVINGEDII